MGDQEGVIHPSHGCPCFPSLQVVFPMSSESLDTILATKTTNSRRELQTPSPGQGGKVETWQVLPRPCLQTKSMLSIGFPESLRSRFPAFPLPPGLPTVPPIQWAPLNVISWEVSYKFIIYLQSRSYSFQTSSSPSCWMLLFVSPKVIDKMAWRIWSQKKCQIMVGNTVSLEIQTSFQKNF